MQKFICISKWPIAVVEIMVHFFSKQEGLVYTILWGILACFIPEIYKLIGSRVKSGEKNARIIYEKWAIIAYILLLFWLVFLIVDILVQNEIYQKLIIFLLFIISFTLVMKQAAQVKNGAKKNRYDEK